MLTILEIDIYIYIIIYKVGQIPSLVMLKSKMPSEEKIVIDTVFHQFVTTEHQTVLRDALLKQCNRILKEVPPNSKYQDWSVYAGTIFKHFIESLDPINIA